MRRYYGQFHRKKGKLNYGDAEIILVLLTTNLGKRKSLLKEMKKEIGKKDENNKNYYFTEQDMFSFLKNKLPVEMHHFESDASMFAYIDDLLLKEYQKAQENIKINFPKELSAKEGGV